MPHVEPLSDQQATGKAKELMGAVQKKLGMVPNIFRTMAHAPDVLEATLQLNSAVQQDLDPKLRELAYYRASQLNDCHY